MYGYIIYGAQEKKASMLSQKIWSPSMFESHEILSDGTLVQKKWHLLGQAWRILLHQSHMLHGRLATWTLNITPSCWNSFHTRVCLKPGHPNFDVFSSCSVVNNRFGGYPIFRLIQMEQVEDLKYQQHRFFCAFCHLLRTALLTPSHTSPFGETIVRAFRSTDESGQQTLKPTARYLQEGSLFAFRTPSYQTYPP